MAATSWAAGDIRGEKGLGVSKRAVPAGQTPSMERERVRIMAVKEEKAVEEKSHWRHGGIKTLGFFLQCNQKRNGRMENQLVRPVVCC